MQNILAKINSQIGYSNRTPLKNLFEFAYTKASMTKRPDVWAKIKDLDIDTIFKKIANNIFRKNPYHLDNAIKEDMMVDAVNAIINNVNTMKSYDPDRTEFGGFFGVVFQNKLKDEISAYMRDREHIEDNFDDTEESLEDQFDRRNMAPSEDFTDNYVQFKQLVVQLDKFLASKPQTAKLRPMLPMLIQGYASKEIAQELGISTGAVSQWLKLLKEAMAEYARKSKNELLLRLVEGLSGYRTSADNVTQPFTKLFDLYQKKRVHSQDQVSEAFHARKPAGSVSRIKITNLTDLYADGERMAQLESDEYVSEEDYDRQIQALIKELQASDDILDLGENKITALKVIY